MADAHRVAWRRAFPASALTSLGWYGAGAAAVLAVVWVLFGSEPSRLDSGAGNPLAALPEFTVALAALGAVPLVVPVLRRPVVTADHYALTVRPGCWRTLVLPWVRVTDVAAYRFGADAYLLVRCRESLNAVGDTPAWCDRAVLRSAARAAGTAQSQLTDFDLAVRMRDFVGAPSALVGTLAAVAPEHVVVASDVHPD